MLTDALILGVLIGLVGRGRVGNLASVSFPFWWLIVLSFAFRMTLPYAQEQGTVWLLAAQAAIYSTLLLAVFANLQKPWLWLVGLGVLANFLVISANKGMPVSMYWVERLRPDLLPYLTEGGAGIHVPMGDGTLLAFLGDVIPFIHLVPLSLPYHPWVTVSAGDVLMSAGIVLFLYWAMTTGHDSGAAKS